MAKDSTAPPKKLSTTALAKLLEMDSKQLFELLVERKWMVREKKPDGSNVNKLTAKGEFEGGEYLESKKFGTYIVWPDSIGVVVRLNRSGGRVRSWFYCSATN